MDEHDRLIDQCETAEEAYYRAECAWDTASVRGKLRMEETILSAWLAWESARKRFGEFLDARDGK